MGQKRGTSMGGVEHSPKWARRQKNKRLKEGFQWAAKAGPVTVTYAQKDENGNWIRPTG